jgi:hypothetical protein
MVFLRSNERSGPRHVADVKVFDCAMTIEEPRDLARHRRRCDYSTLEPDYRNLLTLLGTAAYQSRLLQSCLSALGQQPTRDPKYASPSSRGSISKSRPRAQGEGSRHARYAYSHGRFAGLPAAHDRPEHPGTWQPTNASSIATRKAAGHSPGSSVGGAKWCGSQSRARSPLQMSAPCWERAVLAWASRR